MSDPVNVTKPTPEQEKRWAEAAKQQEEAKQKMGRANDGTYIIVETDQTTGDQTVVCHPDDNAQILRFAHQKLAENWVDLWGEEGFGYLIFGVVGGKNGTRTPEQLKQLKERGFIVETAEPGEKFPELDGTEVKFPEVSSEETAQAIQDAAAKAEEKMKLAREAEAEDERVKAQGMRSPEETDKSIQDARTERMLSTDKHQTTHILCGNKSSNIFSVGHDAEKNLLEVKFKNGGLYRYNAVTLDVFQAFLDAESMGQFFAQNIRGRYEFEKVQ